VLLAAVLTPMALLLSRFERPGHAFAATGFTPLFEPSGHRLLILPVDPPQNLVHLVTGACLAWVAGVGGTDRLLPWLLTAAGSALPFALPGATPVAIVLHATIMALALTIAATRRRPNGPGPRSRRMARA
jgi:hypothetical protein